MVNTGEHLLKQGVTLFIVWSVQMIDGAICNRGNGLITIEGIICDRGNGINTIDGVICNRGNGLITIEGIICDRWCYM